MRHTLALCMPTPFTEVVFSVWLTLSFHVRIWRHFRNISVPMVSTKSCCRATFCDFLIRTNGLQNFNQGCYNYLTFSNTMNWNMVNWVHLHARVHFICHLEATLAFNLTLQQCKNIFICPNTLEAFQRRLIARKIYWIAIMNSKESVCNIVILLRLNLVLWKSTNALLVFVNLSGISWEVTQWIVPL